MRAILLLIVALAIPTLAEAKLHYVASEGATDGASASSQDEVWASFADLLASGHLNAGDIVVLSSGKHGPLLINDRRFSPAVQITGGNGGTVHIERIDIRKSSGLRISDLEVWPEVNGLTGQAVVFADQFSSDVHFKNLDIWSRRNSPSDFSKWSAQDWTGEWSAMGVRLDSARSSIMNSRVVGVSIGITLSGVNSQAVGNTITGFSADGFRALGNGVEVRNNIVQYCFDVDENHRDGIQSWAPKEEIPAIVSDLVIDGNVIIEAPMSGDYHGRCNLQGIGFYDGTYKNILIQNNLIITTGHHGISVYGGIGVTIINNTVAFPNGKPEKHPWIMLSDHKNGSKSAGNMVANNFAMGFSNRSSDKNAFQRSSNLNPRSPARVFIDPATDNYRIRPSSSFLDRGDPEHMSDRDILGQPRPLGNGPDVGAFELP